MAFYRRSGVRDVRTFNSADTLSANELVQFDEAGEVISAVTGKEVLGVTLQSATSADTVLVDCFGTDHELEVTGITGTMANSEIGNEADIISGGGVAVTATLTESNGDILITGWDGSTTSKLYGKLKNLAFGSPGANVQTT